MEGLSFEYPSWYVLLCILLGLAYALVLYFRDQTFREQASWLRWLMGALRFLAVTTLAILLLSPILRSIQTNSQKPVVVIAQDGSESLPAGMNTTDSAAYVQSIQALQSSLADNYEVATYTFGDRVRDTLDFSFSDKRTNLSAVLREVYDLYSNQNLGAVILGSDGIYNEGSNPVYADVKLNAPVYTVALGDTTRKKDLILKRVFNNKIAYLGDQFSIQTDISAQNAAGAATTLTVSRIENGQPRQLIRESIDIDRNDFFTTREFILDADRAGVNRYRISLSRIDGEQTLVNNSRDIFVDVLESRQKILILAHAPHPDLAALKQSLNIGRNNEVEVQYINSLQGPLNEFDLLILHQLPSSRYDVASITERARQLGKPIWYIVGDQSNFNRLSRMQSLVEIQSSGRNTNDAEARFDPAFSLFNLSDEVRESVPNFPPLISPFGEYSTGPNAAVLLYQRIGKIDTGYPLLVLGDQEGVRTAILTGTGIWRWRLFDYLERKNHNRFDELISQVVQYLSLKDDKRRFRVSLAKNIFDENEPIIFDAELYNENYELVNAPTAQLVVTDNDGKEYSYTFNTTGNGYRLNAGILPVGNYRYRATVNTGTETLNFNGQFSVQPIQLERFATTADHDLLQLLSERYGGELLYPAQIGGIPDLLETKGTIKPILYQTVNTRSVINLKWIFFLVLALLTAEWFLRRYYGAY